MTNHPIDREKLISKISVDAWREKGSGNMVVDANELVETINSGELDYDPWVSTKAPPNKGEKVLAFNNASGEWQKVVWGISGDD